MKLYYTSEVQGVIEGRNVMYPNAEGKLWIIAEDEDDAYRILCEEISDVFDYRVFEYYLDPADDELVEQIAEEYDYSFEDLCNAIATAQRGLSEYIMDLLPDIDEIKVDEEKIEEEKETRQCATNFFEWLVDNGYFDKEDRNETIKEMIEDFEAAYEVAPRLINLLNEISDR